MSVLLAVVLVLAVLLVLRPPHGAAARFRRAAARTSPSTAGARPLLRGSRQRRLGKGEEPGVHMTLVVQQLAALLKGGRTPARLWDELWLVYGVPGPNSSADSTATPAAGGTRQSGPGGSIAMLASARAAARTGVPVSQAIRRSLTSVFPRASRERRTWSELAACLDVAEASGCPLADVLSRFAAQLEAEDDADAARQTALAGPKATVTLLTWLPLMGLGLGIALGVDPLAILLGTPLGLAALAAGVVLTVAGRMWSARLVASAAGAGVP